MPHEMNARIGLIFRHFHAGLRVQLDDHLAGRRVVHRARGVRDGPDDASVHRARSGGALRADRLPDERRQVVPVQRLQRLHAGGDRAVAELRRRADRLERRNERRHQQRLERRDPRRRSLELPARLELPRWRLDPDLHRGRPRRRVRVDHLQGRGADLRVRELQRLQAGRRSGDGRLLGQRRRRHRDVPKRGDLPEQRRHLELLLHDRRRLVRRRPVHDEQRELVPVRVVQRLQGRVRAAAAECN